MRIALTLIFFVVMTLPAARGDFYVGPTALGDGSGSDWNNRAAYTDTAFWDDMQSLLNNGPVVVRLAGGRSFYTQGMLNLSLRGHPVNKLTLLANTLHAPVFASAVPNQVDLRGAQNVHLYGLVFSGPDITSTVVQLQSRGKNASRLITIDTCIFRDLTAVKYAAIGIYENSRDITVNRCEFNKVGVGGSAHMLYCDHDARNILVTDCSFTDCMGDYVRFRNDADFAKVDHCAFRSSGPPYDQPFIRIPLFNKGPPPEYFGTDFQFTNNSFTYESVEEVNVEDSRRVAIAFEVTGPSSPHYDFSLTAAEASTLSSTDNVGARAILSSNMGIEADRVIIYRNRFGGAMFWEAFSHWDHADYGPSEGGVLGYINVRPSTWGTSGTLGPAPKLGFNADFERPGQWLRNWGAATRPTWSGNEPTEVAGLNGTSKAARLAPTDSNAMWQWVASPLSSNFTTDVLFNVGSPGATGQVFAVDVVHNTLTDSRVTVGVDDQGRFVISDGSDAATVVLSDLPAITFSNSDWYHLRIVGDYSGDTPHIDVFTSDANSMTLSHSVTGLANWVNGAPATGQKPSLIVYRNNATPVTIDELAWE